MFLNFLRIFAARQQKSTLIAAESASQRGEQYPPLQTVESVPLSHALHMSAMNRCFESHNEI